MAALLGITFITFAVIGRVVLQFRSTGDHGVRFANPTEDPVAAIAGSAFSLSFALSLLLIGLDFTGTWPLAQLEAAHHPHIAAPVGFAGITIVLIAQYQMRNAWRIGVDHGESTELVTHGLFARSRNPIYFGILLYWLGLAGTMPNPLIWGLGIVCWVSIEVIVRKVEEPYLRKLHGASYSDYSDKTNRYLVWPFF